VPTDEQRVRTMAGWIGVEISRSRVRTPGRAGYGLYRVRGTELMDVARTGSFGGPYEQRSEWTAYEFSLNAIYLAVTNSIQGGTPDGPVALYVARESPKIGRDRVYEVVPTRWTQVYRGRRDLGVREAGAEPGQAARLSVDAALRPGTVRSRQRAANAEFQKAHFERRRIGKASLHQRKLDRLRKTQPGRTQE
jgi:hypothetical protein